MGFGDWVWMKRCGGKGGLLAVMVYCDRAIKKCGSGCNYIVGCCNIPVGVERGIERGEDGSGDYLGCLVIILEDV